MDAFHWSAVGSWRRVACCVFGFSLVVGSGQCERACAQDEALPKVPGFEVSVYSDNFPEPLNPVRLSFDYETGNLYVGMNHPTASVDSARILQVRPDGTWREYGPEIYDPDVVTFDSEGFFEWINPDAGPGTLIVGGLISDGLWRGRGRITAILPDETAVTIWESDLLGNPYEMLFDGQGCFVIGSLYSRDGSDIVEVCSGSLPTQTLLDLPHGYRLSAIDASRNLYATGGDGVTRLYDGGGSLVNEGFLTDTAFEITHGVGDTIWGDDAYTVSRCPRCQDSCRP